MKKITDLIGNAKIPKMKKTFRIMKLASFFLMISVVSVLAGETYSQTALLNLNMEKTTVKEVLSKIEDQSEFYFMYSGKVIDVNREVTVNVKNQKIDEVLNSLFAGTDVDYTIKDRIIVLTTPEVVSREVLVSFQQKSVSGKVTDNSNQPLPGVTVVVKGTTQGTVTNADGEFTLTNLPANATLQISFVGMKTQEVVVGSQTSINIMMEEDAIGIEEVVAIGYGTQKKVNLTGSITTVNAEDMEVISVPKIGQKLMGRTPGVFIRDAQGQPGEDGMQINIRGYGTPLYIVDEIPVSSSYFQQLEASDIETLNVLKDASAAIYGARAGNGVILVTTKRGSIGIPKFTYNGNYGLQFFTQRTGERVNSAQYAEMYNVARVNWRELAPMWTAEEIQKFRDGSDPENYPNTDWWSEVLRDYAPQQQHNFSVRGGTETIKYFTSVNYFNQKGMLKSDDIDYNRFTLRSNIDIALTKKLNLGLDFTATNQDYVGPSVKLETTNNNHKYAAEAIDGILMRIIRARPFNSNLPLPDPNLSRAIFDGKTANPYTMSFIDNVGFNKWNKLTGFAKIKLDYELPFNIHAKAHFDLNRIYNRDRMRMLEDRQYVYNSKTETYTLQRLMFPYDFLNEESEITNNLNQQYYLTWSKSINNHSLDVMGVYEILSDKYDYFRAFRRDFEIPLDYLFAGPEAGQKTDGFAREGGRQAYIGRITYNYLGKYLLDFNARYDGSPKFPKETRWGFFPSVSVGWRISEEAFMQNSSSILSNLKLRASHGTLGYDAAGSFQYLETFRVQSQYISDQALESGIRADALPNPTITWEKMTTSNLGIDFNFWDGRLLEGSIDYFYRLRTDVLGTRAAQLPNVVGATLPQENFWEFDNRGWELYLSHSNNIGELNYSIAGNISTNREKTVFQDQSDFASREAYRIGNQNGEWTDRFWAYPIDGLFKTREEIDNWADIDGQGNRSIHPGDIKYIDYNGDGRITGEDRIIAGRGEMPRLMYGMDFSFNWKGFDITMLWQGAGLYNINLRRGSGRTFVFPFDQTPLLYTYENSYVAENPWMPANTENPKWPRFGTEGDGGHTNFNRDNKIWLTKGDYLRLKNLQLGYNIPANVTRKFGLDNLKVYVSGYNLFTFRASEYDFIDPEIDPNAASGRPGEYYPQMGTYNFGLQLNF